MCPGVCVLGGGERGVDVSRDVSWCLYIRRRRRRRDVSQRLCIRRRREGCVRVSVY
ncbi:Hypothetical predicted protein [Pelobates cultripes]|uniref:Uncharacterized protein n=1 Tax=Pelobates cultripes TaxID=61616 RepID=A0AAD1SNZ6_PELCU|nr:Hypothetical predicted protein [Pelobates cultripes]